MEGSPTEGAILLLRIPCMDLWMLLNTNVNMAHKSSKCALAIDLDDIEEATSRSYN